MQADKLKYAHVKNVGKKNGDKKGVLTMAMHEKFKEKPIGENIHAKKCFRVYYPDEDIE